LNELAIRSLKAAEHIPADKAFDAYRHQCYKTAGDLLNQAATVEAMVAKRGRFSTPDNGEKVGKAPPSTPAELPNSPFRPGTITPDEVRSPLPRGSAGRAVVVWESLLGITSDYVGEFRLRHAIALAMVGDREKALRLLSTVQHLRTQKRCTTFPYVYAGMLTVDGQHRKALEVLTKAFEEKVLGKLHYSALMKDADFEMFRGKYTSELFKIKEQFE
jgi:hypothetical protein